MRILNQRIKSNSNVLWCYDLMLVLLKQLFKFITKSFTAYKKYNWEGYGWTCILTKVILLLKRVNIL